MRRSMFAAIAVVILCGAAWSAAADDLIESWNVEGWEGGAYRNADSGEVYCALWDDYGDDAGIWLGWDSLGFYMNVTDPVYLALDPDSTFWTGFRVDQRYSADVYVMETDTFNIDFGHNKNAIEAVKSGERMYFDELDIWYTLYGTRKAVEAIENCYWNYN